MKYDLIRKYKKLFLLAFTAVVFIMGSCVEEIEFETAAIEDYLVVDARLTDEMKKHQVVLSRTYGINDTIGSQPEVDAQVHIDEVDGSSFEFREISPGVYESLNDFRAQAGETYILNIETASGEIYRSEAEEMLQGGELEEIMVERRLYENNDGVAITVNTSLISEGNAYFKYEYEETYKIVSPYRYSTNMFFNFDTRTFYEIWKEIDDEICYTTDNSTELIMASTGNLESNNLNNFLVRFLELGNPKMSFRYSILVKQFTISERAHAYYSTLKDLSSNNNLFSQVQPGFLAGNIRSIDGNQEAIGFFTVAAVDEERIFFNFEDHHSFSDRRTYVANDCTPGAPQIVGPQADMVADQLNDGTIKYIGPNLEPSPGEGPYVFVESPCVDCRFFGELEPPDFWIE